MPSEDRDTKKEEKEETKESKKGNKLVVFLISFLSLVIVLMAVALVVTVQILSNKEQVVVNEISPDYAKVVEDIEKYEVERNKANQEETESEDEESEEDEEEGDEEEEDLFGERQASYGAFYPLDDFVVNLADNAFLKIQIFVEFSSRDVPSNFIAKLVPIRDQVIEVLSGRKADSLKTLTGRDVLRNDIMQEINTIIGRSKDEVKNVYFTNFIVRN